MVARCRRCRRCTSPGACGPAPGPPAPGCRWRCSWCPGLPSAPWPWSSAPPSSPRAAASTASGTGEQLHRLLPRHLPAPAAAGADLVLRRARAPASGPSRSPAPARASLSAVQRKASTRSSGSTLITVTPRPGPASSLTSAAWVHQRPGVLGHHRQEVASGPPAPRPPARRPRRAGRSGARSGSRPRCAARAGSGARSRARLTAQHQLRPGQPRVEGERADHPLAVVELEQLLDRVAVAGGRRDVVEAGDVGRAEVGEEDQVALQRPGHAPPSPRRPRGAGWCWGPSSPAPASPSRRG